MIHLHIFLGIVEIPCRQLGMKALLYLLAITSASELIGADSPIFTLSHIYIQVSLKSPYQTYSFNLNKLIQHHL